MKIRDLFETEATKVPVVDDKGNFNAMYLPIASLVNCKIPAHLDGDFNCFRSKVPSLKGGPSSVGGDYTCGGNKLKTLDYVASSVGGFFSCIQNKLTSLKGAPTKVGKEFYCQNNLLTDLYGVPPVVNEFNCESNKLTSLEGGPHTVHGDFKCSHNKIVSLEGAPSIVNGDFKCFDNELTSLKDIHKIIKQVDGGLYFTSNPISSHVLGVLLIKGVTHFDMTKTEVQDIVNKYLPNERGMGAIIDCQSELIEAGFEDFAQL